MGMNPEATIFYGISVEDLNTDMSYPDICELCEDNKIDGFFCGDELEWIGFTICRTDWEAVEVYKPITAFDHTHKFEKLFKFCMQHFNTEPKPRIMMYGDYI